MSQNTHLGIFVISTIIWILRLNILTKMISICSVYPVQVFSGSKIFRLEY